MEAISTIIRIEVAYKPGLDATTRVVETAHQLGLSRITDCRLVRLFFLEGKVTPGEVEQIATELLADPVTERFEILENQSAGTVAADHTIDVTLLPGVTDPAAENLLRAAHLLGILEVERAASGERYLISGDLSSADLKRLANEICANPVIQRYSIDEPISAPFFPYQAKNDVVEIVPLREADDDTLLAISQERRLSLNLREMRAIRDHFYTEGREPTDAELEMLAQTWSEHCVHKTFKAWVDYSGPEGSYKIDGILKTYLRAATDTINKPWVHSAFIDNAGIIAFDDQFDIAFKVETHNRPSAIEPFGGANTGVGGVIRDVIGVSARPIANTDVLCFGPPDLPYEALQPGVLHPNRIAEGVISGVEDYGNKMGIPTVNGAIYYHRGYTSNPLVYCGCLGILPHGTHRSEAQPGDLIVVIGGRTGRDGIRGATFSSMEINQETSTVSGGAVQIGHPIHEKQALEAILRARDEELYNAITDCGAGGLSSAVGEMGEKVGAWVQLNDVPLKYPGLRPWEIWLSEAQERMVLAVAPEKWARVKAICDGQDIEAVVIGEFRPTGRLELYYDDQPVGDLPMDFLHDGLPRWHLKAEWQPPEPVQTHHADASATENLSDTLLKLLAHPNIRSKEDVIRCYDHEVQGGTSIKPLVGTRNHGPSDAAVIVPYETQRHEGTKAIALSNSICPQYGDIDPYAMAWAAVDEAVRNMVAVGADPDQIAILDNFCWGNTSLPDRLGALVRCAQGCHDAAIAYGTPFISGKDSLNNEFLGADGERHPIPGTLVISAVGIVPDVSKAVTMDLKEPGNLLYVIGETRDEMGGSHYNLLHGIAGGTVPQPNSDAINIYRALHKAIQAGLVQSCHDMSEGGLAVALAEMGFAGELGVKINTYAQIPGFSALSAEERARKTALLFAESTGRFIVEVKPEDQNAFEQQLGAAAFGLCGQVTESSQLTITDDDGEIVLDAFLMDLEHAWRGDMDTNHIVEATHESPLHTPSATFTASTHTQPPKVLILHATGTNRDHDAALACKLAGGQPEIVHVNQLLSGERELADYHMLVVPGGFSYGDDLGAGTVWAMDLRHRLHADIEEFIESGRPVIGICNGFQTLVKAGLLPGNGAQSMVTLARNEKARFECRWVYLQPNPNSHSLFTQGLDGPIYCPVAHGEGRVVARDQAALDQLWADGLAALTYVDDQGNPVGYPFNPNGSDANIAGLSNPAGNVFGLMPHPENHVFPWQHPRYHRGDGGMLGLRIFQNGIRFA
ncbi:MAG: phosphoribosylformylglycinamidine synthase subunit PurL [Anaerolineae bacterium]|nr:phosphoribosylformylglycinamidine synthase subunit PurL [Anaerolineae bacterium]